MWQPWKPDAAPWRPPVPPVIGHRGAAGRAPENTLEAIDAAAGLDVTWVEVDVMLSADEVPVLIHDEAVSRTTNGTGRVPELPYARLRALDAGGGARIPTLDEAIDRMLALGLGANIEIKPAHGHERRTAEITARILRERWPAEGPGLLISSFSREALAVAADIAPKVPRGLLQERLPEDWSMALQRLGCATLHLSHRRLSDDELVLLVELHVPVLLYTVNDAERARRLLGAGAVAVFSDVPDAVMAGLAQ